MMRSEPGFACDVNWSSHLEGNKKRRLRRGREPAKKSACYLRGRSYTIILHGGAGRITDQRGIRAPRWRGAVEEHVPRPEKSAHAPTPATPVGKILRGPSAGRRESKSEEHGDAKEELTPRAPRGVGFDARVLYAIFRNTLVFSGFPSSTSDNI